MEAVEYMPRPPAPIKAYQFTIQNANEFVKLLWGWNYLTRLSGSTLVFQQATGECVSSIPVYGMYDGDYIIEHTDDPGWRLEVVTQRDFEDRYTVHIPIETK